MNEIPGNPSEAPGAISKGVPSPGFQRLVGFAVWFGVILIGGYHLGLHLAAVRLAEPMGSWETVYAAISRVWPAQYQWSNHVDGHDGYGPGYPTFVRPFLLAGFDVYVAHRVASLVALLLACGWVGLLLRRNGCSWRASAGIAAIVYAINAGSYSIQARPDFLVLLEITALLALGEAALRRRFRVGPLFGLLFGVLALAAFFTKAYAVVAWGGVLLVLAVLVDRRGAIVAAALGAAVIGGGIWLYASLNPLYVLEVFRGQQVQAAPSLAWLGHQTVDFALLACGLVAVAIIPVGWAVLRRGSGAQSLTMANASVGREVEKYWRWQAVIAAAFLAIGPGWHAGAYLTYFLHLLLVPLAMVAGLHVAKPAATERSALELALIVNLAVLGVTAPGWPQPDPGWAELRQDILAEKGRVAVDYLMEPIAREKGGVLVVSTGQSGYTLQEPFRMTSDSATVKRARTTATEFIRQQTEALFGRTPMDAIYLDCVVVGGGAKGGRFSAIPRNELPYLSGPEMQSYVAVRSFEITPFYFATNAPRQEAGNVKTTILKFVRKK